MAKKLTESQKAASAEKRAATKAMNAEAEAKKRIEDGLAGELKELRKQPKTNKPRYTYSVGEVVDARTANWDSLTIKEILDDGLIFLCEINSTRNNYGTPVKEVSTRYLSHLEIIPASLKLKPQISSRESRQISFHNTMIFSLIGMHYRAKVDYSPVYQRELVWELKDKQSLIHSIFNNIEIGKFAFIDRKYEDNGPAFEILDGKQRMNAIIEFYEDVFPYNGIYFSELSNQDKSYFTNYNITYGRGDDKWTLEEKMKYFLKMNVAGVPQSEEHLQHVAKLLKKEQKKA